MKRLIYFILGICIFISHATAYADIGNIDPNAPSLEAELIVSDTDPTLTEGVRLSWTAVPGITYYRVFRAEYSGGYTYALTDFAIGGLSYIDVKTRPDKTYYYIVRTLISEGNALIGEDEVYGRPSNEVMIEVKSAPPGPVANKGYILMQIDNPIMEVNGNKTEVDPGRGTAPFLRDDRTVLPIRATVEAMDGMVLWDDIDQKITLIANTNRVEMRIGALDYSVNGYTKTMDIEPFIENERTFIPLRFAAYNLNCRVTWINKSEEILIVFNGTASIMN